eukprot:GHVT01001058.1.p2 GENE.GHVT01001058.1~~GHVT01001058.1.p2  ORF type:complete len:123 (+),score=18.22 GHVT01001058.1:929-1297(+)
MTQVLTSKFSHVTSLAGIVQEGAAMDFSNASLGLIFYSATFFYPRAGRFLRGFYRALATGSLIISGYLAYVLVFILKDLCLVCCLSYVINIVIFALVFLDSRPQGKARGTEGDGEKTGKKVK